MSISHLYSDFGSSQFSPDSALSGEKDDKLEEANLAAFENGYQAGWDDATTAHQNAHQNALSELSQTFQDMSFTYQEAFSRLIIAMRPVLTSIVTKLLPEAARGSLGAQIVAEVSDLLKSQGGDTCEIVVAPGTLEILEDIAERAPQLPFRFSADPALKKGQAFIRNGSAEREINLDALQQSIADAIEAFLEQTERDLQHG